jgi:predicted DNA-binding protein YlxM (UPF0122 family)
VAKIPADAFDLYYALGPARSYQAVAEKYRVSKKAVVNRAKREGWQKRLLAIEEKARATSDEKKRESVEAMNERQLQQARFLQAKAINALKDMPVDSVLAAVRALEVGARQERLIYGEPSERTSLSVEDVIKREYERWMVTPPANDSTDTEKEKEDHDGDNEGAAGNGLQ